MKEIEKLDFFPQKVLIYEAPGKEPERVSIVVPSIVSPGVPFTIKISVMDKNGYPSLEFDEGLKVRGGVSPFEITFKRGEPAIAFVKGAVVQREGFFRLETELNGRKYFSNPCFCTSSFPFRIYWGDPHVHSLLSNCIPKIARSLNFAYIAAKYLTGLDWVSITDHVSNGRSDRGKWREQRFMCEEYNEDFKFITIPGYEASLKGGAGGDNNVYFLEYPDIFVDEYENGNAKTLCEKLKEKIGEGKFFMVPHHTTRNIKHGEISDEIYPGHNFMPVLEIYSKWGTSEYRGNPAPLKEIHPGPSYAVDFLNRGLKFGFIAGTDTHATMPGGFGEEPSHIDRLPGLTAIYSPKLTRTDLFYNIKNNNCYATCLERIYLDVLIAGERPGKILKLSDIKIPVKIKLTAAAQSNILYIEVIKNGKSVYKQSVNDWKVNFKWVDEENIRENFLSSKYMGDFLYYYIRLTCSSGAMVWSTPVWFQCQ